MTTDLYSKYAKNWSKKRKSGQHFSHDFLEKPAMQAKLPQVLKDQKVLCIGCGDGSECDLLWQKGAVITGIDSSLELIVEAKKNYPDLKFLTMKAEEMNFEESTFDFVYSSLVLHYLADWKRFFEDLKKILKPKGRFLFSVHHPIKWSSQTFRSKEFNQFLLGYQKSKKNPSNYQIYGDYLNFHQIKDTLFGKLEITYFHRSFEQIFAEINSSKFKILDVLEPKPIESSKSIKPDFYETYSKIPLFLILEIQNQKE